MAVDLGSTAINGIYLGSTVINAAYLGSTQVFATAVPTFTFTVNTANTSTGSTAIKHFKVPTVSTGTYACHVDWGDASSDDFTTYDHANWDHTYAADSTYTINITGTIEGLQFNNGGDKLKFLNVSEWGPLAMKTGKSANAFMGCTNFTCSATDLFDVSGLSGVDWGGMFRACTNFNGDLSGLVNSSCTSINLMMFQCGSWVGTGAGTWDVSAVTTFASAFYSCTVFNTDVSGWDVNSGGATDFSNAFFGCAAFNQPLNAWVMTNATSLAATFRGCTVFNQDLDTWNVANVTTMNFTFGFCPAFNGDISTWNPTALTGKGFESAFYFCTNFNSAIPLIDISGCTSLALTFTSCLAFNQDISGFVTSSVTTINSMMYGATGPARPQDLVSWDVSIVTNMGIAFRGATALISAMDGTNNLSAWDADAATNLVQFCLLTTMPTTAYDPTLVAWSALPSWASSLTCDFGSAKYTGSGATLTAHNYFTSTLGWTLNDGGTV